jgi:outer membrane protein assembly factor BamA
VKVYSDREDLSASELKQYIHLTTNSKWFSLFKTQLYIYNMSGRDTTKWENKTLRKLGDSPVIFNEKDAERSQQELLRAVQNKGYMSASVGLQKKMKRKKLELTYVIKSGDPYILRHFNYNLKDKEISNIIQKHASETLIHEKMHFDINIIDAERDRIANLLNNSGYYRFSKEYITFIADTVRGSKEIDLHMQLVPFPSTAKYKAAPYRQYRIDTITIVTDFDMMESTPESGVGVNDSIHYKGYPIYFKDKLQLRPKVLVDNLYLAPGNLYRNMDLQRTYSHFGRFSALTYSNIRFNEVKEDSTKLNSYVLLTRGRNKSASFEIEGTNSAGDLGAAASVSFQHRNLFYGSELLTLKFRGAYEAISGLEGYTSNGYYEAGAEATLNFPRFIAPFISKNYRRRSTASTELGFRFNYQRRPEFSRTVFSSSWSYKWNQRQRIQHRFDLLDISYIYLPWISDTFRENYINKGQNYIFEYNYTSRFIVRTGYTYVYNSLGNNEAFRNSTANSYSIRAGFESAGNLLYLFSKAVNLQQNTNGQYSIFDIPFAQYLKADFDYVKKVILDKRNTLAIHTAFGIAVPYLNSKSVPFEKQYFSGGANSVRGWAVRELGPGKFAGNGNYLDQSGDIKLDASIELRTRLFWKFRGAAFVDAGNIWSIKSYENQPGGVFRFKDFYKEIAVAYGLGLRIDFDFCVLRFDFGMKALNPVYASGRDRYPISHPSFKRDMTFHFAVGYPF